MVCKASIFGVDVFFYYSFGERRKNMAQTVVIDIMARVQDQTSQGVSKIKNNVDKLGNSIQKTQQQIAKMSRTKGNVNLSVKDKATKAIEKITKNVSNLSKKTWNVSMKVVDKATAPLKGIVNLLKNPLLQAGAVIGVSLGIADAFETYQTFEKSMSNVKALSGANAVQMEQLTAKAREMGRTTTKSASEAADALGYMALAGWDTDTMLKAIEPTLRLSEAGNMDLGRTSDLVTDSMSSLGIGADELNGYLDKVARTASRSNTDIDAMMEAFLEFGGTVKQNNISLEEASSLIGILANRGVKRAEAGNALNSVFMNLTTGYGRAGKAMKELNLSAFDAQGNFKGYANVLKELNDKTKDMTEEQRNYYLSAIGGKTRLSDTQKLLAGVSEEYDKLYETVSASDGALKEMATIMSDNIYGDVKALQSAAESVKIDFMEKMQPSIRKLLQWLTKQTLRFGESLEKAADKFQKKMERVQSIIKDFTTTSQWKNANLAEKITIAWDKIIAEPFDKWWSSNGKAWASGVANKIGYGIGSALTAGASALLGINLSEATESGFDIGKSFADSFLAGFDGSKIWEAIKEQAKNTFLSTSHVLPGGEKATGGDWLMAGLLAYGGIKAGKGLGIGKLIGKLKSGRGTTTLISGAGLSGVGQTVSHADDYTAFWQNAKLWNTTTRESAMGAYQRNWRMTTSMSNATKSLGGIGSIFDNISVKVAPYVAKLSPKISKAGKFLKGNGLSLLFSALAIAQAENKAKETVVQGGGFAASMAGGSLGAKAGAAIGTAIVPGAGTAIGGAIGGVVGGIGGYIGGEKFFRWVTDKGEKLFQTKEEKAAEEAITKEKEKQLAIEKTMNDIQNIRTDLKNTNDLIWETEQLKNGLEKARAELDKTDLSEEDRLKTQEKINDIVGKLARLYPDIISAEDEINDRLKDRLSTQQEINRAAKELQRIELEKLNEKNKANFDKIEKDYINRKEEVAGFQKQENDLKNLREEMIDLSLQREYLAKQENLYRKSGENEKAQQIRQQRFDTQYQLDDLMKSYGFSQGIGEGQYTVTDRNSMLSVIDERLGENYTGYIDSLEKMEEIERKMRENRENYLKAIELNYGEPIEEAIQKYDQMDAAGKEALKNTLKQVAELNQKYKELPDKLFTEAIIKIVYDGVLPQNLLHQYGIAGPIQPEIKTTDIKLVKKNATGGFVNQAHLGIIGEAGPEAIIPLAGTNKHRGISLWQEAGRMLGMLPKHANGGIFGGNVNYKELLEGSGKNQNQESFSKGITIHLGGMNFTFTGANTTDKEGIMTVIRQQMPNIANEIAETIAKELQKVLLNSKTNIA